MQVEFSVKNERWKDGEEGWGDVGEDGWVPVVFVAGLEGAIEVEGADAVEFGLDVEWVGEFVGVVFPALGEHGFHKGGSKLEVREVREWVCVFEGEESGGVELWVWDDGVVDGIF